MLKKLREVTMATAKKEITNVCWDDNLDDAMKRAKAENKCIILDFFNPG